jgi:PKD repeat protein
MGISSSGKSRWFAAGTAALLLAGVGVVTGGLPATAAAPAVVINELMYNPASDLDGDEFVELMNTTAAPVDVSGWKFSSGITATLPAGTTIAGNGFLVLSPDPARFHTTYGGTAAATYTGKLSNGGEKVALADAAGTQVDAVTYGTDGDWAYTPDGNGPSLELVDPALSHDDPLNWAASTNARGNTVGAPNATAHAGLAPRLTGLTATPAQPAANQPVTISVTMTGASAVQAFYRVDFGAEVSLAMTAAGGDAWTATLPGVAAGHLLRYRVQATNAVGTSRRPRVDDTIVYQGVEAASGVTSAIPILEWFIPDADYDDMVNHPFDKTIVKQSVLAYGGVVYDNASVNIRGNTPSRENPKQSFTFDLPHGHDLDIPGVLLDPVDTFAMESNWNDHSHARQILSYNSYSRAKVLNEETFPIRTQRNARFQGLYLWVDKFDGTWRDREGYSDKGFYKAEDAAWDPSQSPTFRFTKETPKDGDYGPVVSFVNGVNLTGTARRNYLLANGNLPEIINYAAATAIVQHVDSANHNFYLSQDPASGRWSILPWDLDKTFGITCCTVDSPFVTPAEPGDKTNLLMQALLAEPDWKAMYFRRLKTLVDQLLAPGLLEGDFDRILGPAQPEWAADLPLWPNSASYSYSSQRTSLFNALNTRRAAFRNDARVPAAQSAAPDVVINEIQHTPTGGGNAEFLELYNPSATEAVDLSGWSISDAVTLQVQPGTVILPHGFMTFAANDATFRSTYGSTIFLGGTYSGGLSGGETITLKRADGSTDDVVTYGGAGWPQVTAGQSLELTDPTADNNLGSSWALSPNPGGSPGAGNGTGANNTPPVAAFTSSCSGLTCTFDGSGSNDPDGNITSYSWQFGDTATGTGANPSHPYATAGSYPVTLTVTDNKGATTSVTHAVSVSTAPLAFVGAAHGQGGSVSTLAATVPATAHVGDTAVMVMTTSTSSAWSGPGNVTGWTQLDTFTNGSTTSTAWTKTLASGDPGKQVQFTATSAHKAVLDVAVYAGVASATPVSARVGDAGRTTHTTPTVTAPAGSWVVSMWTDKSDTTTSWTAPASTTRRDTALGTGSGRFSALVADSGGPVAGGSNGGLTATTNAASSYGDMWTIVLAPAAGGGGGGNQPPVAAFTSGCTGLTCSFDASGSSDDGSIASYSWQFGDNTTGTGQKPSHPYATAGNYTVTLTVTDDQGATGSISHPVSPSSTGTPVAFVGAAHGQTGAVSTLAATVPATAHVGDTAVMVMTTSTSSGWSAPTNVTGWTQLDSFTNGSTTSTAWTKTLATGDPGKQVRFTAASAHKAVLDVAVYSGVAAATPVNARVGDAGRTTHTTPTVTAPAGSWVLSMWTDKSETTTSWTAPASVTVRDTALGTGSGRFTALVADSGGPVAAGSNGGLTATTNAASSYADMWTVVLAAAG